ncbi:MAG: molybdopterin-binding protein [Desulfurococcaceae archaeon]
MKTIRVEDAVGKRIAHDYTCITLDFKGAIKRRGDIIDDQDIPLLKKCGHYYVRIIDEDIEDSLLHEDEAVIELAKLIVTNNVHIKPMQEAKTYLYSKVNGLLLVDSERLAKINSGGVFVVVTKKTGKYVKQGELIGVIDVIPLYVEKDTIDKLEKELVIGTPLIRVIQTVNPRVGLIITGSEIVDGLREDLASPIVLDKLKQYDCLPGEVVYARDDLEEIYRLIVKLLESHDAVVLTGGMSVDPTDYTPKAILLAADEVLAYGIPIKPTTMSMIAYKGNKAIIGVSSGIIHFPEENILDIVLPWVSSNYKIPKTYIHHLGEGGLLQSFLNRMTKRD